MKRCTHERYKTKDYMMYSNALKAKEQNKIRRMGSIVANCEDCGLDISHAKRVKVEFGEKQKQPTKKYNIVIRGQKSSMICYEGETIEEAEAVCRLKFGDNFEGISE